MDWKGIIPEEDLEVARVSGNGKRAGWGENPALLVIDAQYDFLGLKVPILESVRWYPRSVGEKGWVAVGRVAQLLSAARADNIPVYYTQQWNPPREHRFDSFARKQTTTGTLPEGYPNPTDIVAELSPAPGEIVIQKRYASAFAGTPLISFLVADRVDTLVVCGFVTSGCVRGAVVDGHALNLKIIVPGDACQDRFQISHHASLFDIDMKYGDVVATDEVLTIWKA